MAATPLDSALYGLLLSDPELAPVFSDAALIAEMIGAERALARAQGRLGMIPPDAAAAIDEALTGCMVAPEALAAETAADGVPVPALVRALRQAVGGSAAHYLHWGATSQDILDTATICQLQAALAVLERRLGAVAAAFAGLADRHRATVMVGRTRGQQAAPTSFGLKAANWAAPLLRHRRRLHELRPRVLTAALGGAVGNLSAMGDRGLAVAAAFAEELGLACASGPWHVQRDGLAEAMSWAVFVSGSLGKIAQDVIQLAQNEIGELEEGGGGGGSSTMPNKANPVLSEAVLALARSNAGLLGQAGHLMLHAQERDGAAWQQEWLVLPQVVLGTGAALGRMQVLSANLVVKSARMARNLEATNGLVMAEAASFALAAHMDRPEAQAMVKAACADVLASGRHLVDVLAAQTDAPVNWSRLRDPRAALGQSDALIDRVLEESTVLGHD